MSETKEMTWNGYSKWGNPDDYYVRTCVWSPPGDHPVGCGMVCHVVNGRLVDVEGDENHPISHGTLCVRCLDTVNFVYNPQRVIYPLKRVGARGENRWQRITWEEAVDIIAERTAVITEKYGPESIVVWCGTGRESTMYYNPLAFAVFRSPNPCYPMSGFACYGPRQATANFLFGTGYPEVDYAQYFPDRYDDERYEIPKYLACWGKLPLFTNSDSYFGHSQIEMVKRGTKLMVIDPRITWWSTRAVCQIQLRPGTDSAVGLAIINELITNDLYDHDFVENWCYGFEDLAARAAEMPASRAAEIAWVKEKYIVEFARRWGEGSKEGNCCLTWGLAMDATTTGGQAGHCALVLMAICGNLDVPGGQTLGLRSTFLGKWRYDTAKYCEPGAYEEKRIGVKEWPGFAAGLGVAQPDEVLETLETDKPYPIRMSFFQSSNFLTPTCCVVPQRWYDALTKLEFNVITDLFMNPCAVACCDIFLPVSASIEHVGIVTPHFGRNQHFLGAMNKVLQVGECKSDLEIMIMLGKRINPVAWPWDTPQEFFDDQLKLSYPFGWEELSEMVYWQEPFEYHKYETGKLRPDGQPGFNTATGKCELKSTIYPLLGEEDPLPYFKEPVFSPYSTPELWKSYPFVLTTGARKVTSFHSEHRQNAVLREIDPWPQLEVNPEDAAELGITDDCWVAIENWLGQARLKAKITPTIHRHVVHATHGWWYPEQEGAEPNLFGNWKSNINSLMPHKLVNMLGLGSIHKDMICKVYKVEGLEINDDLQHRKVAADYVGNGVPENYRKTKGQVTFKLPVD